MATDELQNLEDNIQRLKQQLAGIVTELTAITKEPPPELASAQILELLNQILAKLNQPERSAAAKLKAAISTIPPFVSLTYEAELDTESTFKRYFPTFNRAIAGVKNRLKK